MKITFASILFFFFSFTPFAISQGNPEPPTLIGPVKKISNSSAQIRWKAPNVRTSIHGYNIYLNGQYLTTVTDKKNQTVLTELEPTVNYRVSVVTIVKLNGKDLFSPQSDPLFFRLFKKDVKTGETLPKEIKDNYKLVFNDEFESNSLDLQKWNTQYIWGPDEVINNELQYYVDIKNQPQFGFNPFKMDGNHLNINAIKTPSQLKSKANGQAYLSGAMTTWDSFKATYGYFEVRAKIPAGKGLWSAFWLLHSDQNKSRPEIDIMESLGDNTGVIYNTYHWEWSNRTESMTVTGHDFSKKFHVYAVKWEPGLIVWYLDGVEKNRFKSKKVSNEKMYILLNLAVGGNWPGSPNASTKFPAKYKIDYVRAYVKK